MHGVLAATSRVHLLDVLRASDRPLDARELAAASRLHVSTVRFHLDVLVEAGLVLSRPAPGGTRGRPRLLYTPASAGGVATAADTGYQLLAAVLAGHWAQAPGEGVQRAERAGRVWAGAQGLTRQPLAGLSVAEAAVRVSGLFAGIGFDPELRADGETLQIRLHACPFRSVAEAHPEVVCSLHLGLLRGALDELGAPPATTRLQPFVEPHLCLAHITPDTERASAGGRV